LYLPFKQEDAGSIPVASTMTYKIEGPNKLAFGWYCFNISSDDTEQFCQVGYHGRRHEKEAKERAELVVKALNQLETEE
jgi:hypothetical protein